MSLQIDLKHAEITGRLIGLFFEVYRELGHGFLESVYEEAYGVALAESGLDFKRQVPLTVLFRGRTV
jgi:GxxExxY protein